MQGCYFTTDIFFVVCSAQTSAKSEISPVSSGKQSCEFYFHCYLVMFAVKPTRSHWELFLLYVVVLGLRLKRVPATFSSHVYLSIDTLRVAEPHFKHVSSKAVTVRTRHRLIDYQLLLISFIIVDENKRFVQFLQYRFLDLRSILDVNTP